MNIHSCLPPLVYYTAASTGDFAWLRSLRPALDAIASFLGSRGLKLNNSAGAPVVYQSPSSGLADGGRHAANW